MSVSDTLTAHSKLFSTSQIKQLVTAEYSQDLQVKGRKGSLYSPIWKQKFGPSDENGKNYWHQSR
jgi:hypothetical protein